jgi:hypothetical protein
MDYEKIQAECYEMEYYSNSENIEYVQVYIKTWATEISVDYEDFENIPEEELIQVRYRGQYLRIEYQEILRLSFSVG